MPSPAGDPMARKTQADLLLERTAIQLRDLLQEAAAAGAPSPRLHRPRLRGAGPRHRAPDGAPRAGGPWLGLARRAIAGAAGWGHPPPRAPPTSPARAGRGP